MLGGAEWQTIALWSVLGIVVLIMLYRLHTSDAYDNFCLLDLIAEEGKVSATKFMAFGAFLVSTFGTVICVIRGEVPAEMVLLLSTNAGVFVLGRLGNQKIGTEAAMQVRTAEIRRGRFEDVPLDADIDDPNAISVEEEETRSKPRRRRTDSVFK